MNESRTSGEGMTVLRIVWYECQMVADTRSTEPMKDLGNSQALKTARTSSSYTGSHRC